MSVKKIKCKALRAARRAARLWEPDPIVLPEIDAVTARVIHYRWHDRAHNDAWRQPFATELEAWEDVLQFYSSTAYDRSQTETTTTPLLISP